MSRPTLKQVSILGLGLLTVLAMGCMGKGYAAPKPDVANFGLSGPTRNDCSQIAGTPFRNDDERNWFKTNCSKWPETNFDSLTSVKSTKPEDPACAAQRGKPYKNDTDRQWFLANCSPTAPGGTPTASSSSSDPVVFADTPSYVCGSAPATPTPTKGQTRATPPDNSLCGAVPSIPGTKAAAPTPAPGDRTDCYQISGTPYHSKTEQAWYEATCLGAAPTGQPSPAIPGAPGTPIPGVPNTQPPVVNTPSSGGVQLFPQNYYCNPANPGYPNARGRVTQPC